jgi:hypothetical protein
MSQPPGSGGLIPPPVNAPAGQATPVGVQPGSTTSVVRVRQVIVSGTAEGVFVYSGKAELGNPPVAALTGSSTDPYGNPVQPEISSRDASGDVAYLNGAALYFLPDGAYTAAQVIAGLGRLLITNVLESSGDTPGQISMESADASGLGVPWIGLLANQVQLSIAAAANIPVAASIPSYPYPADPFTGSTWGSGERTDYVNDLRSDTNNWRAGLIDSGVMQT